MSPLNRLANEFLAFGFFRITDLIPTMGLPNP